MIAWPDAQAGTSRFGMGDPLNSLRQGFAIQGVYRLRRHAFRG
jgi:hypothetical protein